MEESETLLLFIISELVHCYIIYSQSWYNHLHNLRKGK